MSRSLDSCPDKIHVDLHYPEMIERQYTIQLLTPLYGGGIKAGMNDPLTLIRPASVRGNLRFWWRAMRGASFTDAAGLKKREDEVWGSTLNPSPVQVEVKVTHNAGKRRSDSCFGFDEYGPEAYALFPARETNENSIEISKEGGRFLFTIRWYTQERLQKLREMENQRRKKAGKKPLGEYKDIQKDVEAAFWAWVNFGGIGARTRRGLGAIYCLNSSKDKCLHPPSLEGFGSWLMKMYEQFDTSALKSSDIRPWPLLPFEFFVGSKRDDSLSAWHEGLKLLKDFRQGKSVGRDPGEGMALGRSRWPEAESIRELVMRQRGFTDRAFCSLKAKDTRIPTTYFPRAEFGMPIIFELRDEEIPIKGCEREKKKNIKPTLVPGQDTERMASPLILRPIRFQDGSSAALAFFLRTPPLDRAYLKPGECDFKKGKEIESHQIRSAELATYSDSPMGPASSGGDYRSSSGSALEAFKSFVEEKKFRRVVI
ncbi:MAG: type III-B CRISPR module RAMP protein Cmr1 [Dissulfuribacterales bacterium]